MADPPISAKVRGLDELTDGTRELVDQIEDHAPRAFLGVADQVAADVRTRVPRRTGALAGSVTVELINEGANVGIGGPDVPYAGWIEFGGTRGRPYIAEGRYLYPTAFEADAELERAGGRLADKEIRGMRWPKPT